jgi:hypothetical protein
MNHRGSVIGLVAGTVAVLACFSAFTPARANLGQTAAQPRGCEELVVNGGFEEAYAGWGHYSKLGLELIDPFNPHSGDNSVWMGIRNDAEDWMAQTLALPADGRGLQLSYWWSVITEEDPGITDDIAQVQLLRADGSVIASIQDLNSESGEQYVYYETRADLSPYAGQTLQLRFYAKTDKVAPSHFYFDDVSLLACPANGTPTPTPTATRPPQVTPQVRLYLPTCLR